MAQITPEKIKEILKRLKANKYYEHINHIIHKLTGNPVPNFPPEVEEKLRQMFKMIQIPFFNHAPRSRKNFLSYSYTIHIPTLLPITQISGEVVGTRPCLEGHYWRFRLEFLSFLVGCLFSAIRCNVLKQNYQNCRGRQNGKEMVPMFSSI
jgi:Poxvirus Late Transcription Factor VLTF3 like